MYSQRKEGVGGKMAKFMVAIAYGRGVMCAIFIKEHFPEMFEHSKSNVLLQDGDPSQNSAMAREAMESIGCKLFKIPARSPDLNPIVNIFHLISNQLKRDALDKGIKKENYSQFCSRDKKTCLNFSSETIDKTIDSMPKRINLIIKSKGLRTKY